MLTTFRREPERAYAYAIQDAVLTLLVQERMAATHRQMYLDLGFEEESIPPFRSMLGSRVADMTVRSVARDAEGAASLSGKGKASPNGAVGKVSLGKVKALLHKGSGNGIAQEHRSVFGEQTGQTHGGLLFSRSPSQLFHGAPGMFRDVDLSGCYANVMGSMHLYAGRPVIHEPGNQNSGMTLRDAVKFLNEHAAGRDAWIIKASGKITQFPNALIPSTKNALTNANHKRRAARRDAKAGTSGFMFDWHDGDRPDEGTSSIYTDVVEAGVVAWPTWLMIQGLPKAWRKEYESLEVDTILFYPKKLVADSGPEFHALVEKRRHDGTPWSADIDMDKLLQTIRWRINDDFVTLRFDLGRLAKSMQEKREEAKKNSGKGSSAERGWKQAVNSMYGVVASPHMASNNVVAANVITATARALAFAMQMSLNGIQVITDGCTYRRDQVPTRPFAECLAACRDYPINRADFAGPFLDPTSIPDDDKGFTAWYQGHVKQFFGVSGPEYDRLFALHTLEHKKTGKDGQGGPVAFDGLCCDGSSNYVKLLREGDEWKRAVFKARSFPPKAKDTLAPWIVRTYSTDTYDGPPPLTEATTLLSYKAAGRVARKVLQAERAPEWVYYPLGLEEGRIGVYKVLKASGFLFRTPRQQRAWIRALEKFRDETSCGLELLALRNSSAERQQGSIADVACMVYRLIRAGKMNPSKALNLTRSLDVPVEVQVRHSLLIPRRKAAAFEKLARAIDAAALDEGADLTGLFVCLADITRLSRA